MDIKYEEDGHFLKMVVKTINGTTNSAWHFDTTYEYVVCPTGDVMISVSGVLAGKLEDTGATMSANGSSANMAMGGKRDALDMFPRIGVTMHLDESMENVRYFGRGPRKLF